MFKHINESIMNADWLNDTTKANLLRVYGSVRRKDVTEQAFSLLEFDGNDFTPYAYKDMMILLIRCLALDEVKTIMGAYGFDTGGEMLYRLYQFFENLDGESFDKLLDIEKVYNGYAGRTKTEIEAESYNLLKNYKLINDKGGSKHE
ncbi:hypothetical protein RYH73_03385 [Olivibacter sp. CPCC 100613]|uniref:hypothetical protein n=1 Tax=Olivibacter sp. CPCC 100613 TaxID=3079931 RepID=UPI002FF8CB74